MLDPHRDGPPALASEPRAPALDGIRGVAILVVLVYHFANSLNLLGVSTPLLKPFALGWGGVDIFFALSGFLITGILLDTRSEPHYFTSFYARRVLRIFPLYYIALLAVYLLRAWIPDAGIWGTHGWHSAPGSLVWPAAFLQNVAIGFGGRGGTGVTTHYWSLAVEEHFYLVWPLLVWLVRTRKAVMLLAVLALSASVVGRAVLWLNGVDMNRVFGLTPVRLDGLALGAFTAALVRQTTIDSLRRSARAVLAASIAALAALVLIRHTTEQDDAVLWLFSYPLVSTGAAAAIILGLADGWVARLLSLHVLRWFGKYSYGLYVWHPIVGVLLFHSTVGLSRPGRPATQVLLAAGATLAVDLVVVWLSYHWVEKHFLALKRYFTPSGVRAPRAPDPSQPADSAQPAKAAAGLPQAAP